MSQNIKRTLKQLQKSILTFAYNLPVFQEWLDDYEIAKIESDATVISSLSIRKSQTLKKELLIECKNQNIKTELEKIISYEFINQVLDTPLQGFGVFELNWYEKDYLFYPKPVERDYRLFSLKEDKLYYNLEEVDKFKAIYLTSRSKFNAKLGRPLYNTLFWLRKFKAASLEFWVELLEKFGSPWVIGKTEGDKNIMAEELYSMLGGDNAVIGIEDTIDIKTPTDKGAFKEILTYIDNQIRQAIIGTNLTANVEKGSYAAAKAHKEVSEDIALSDANLVNQAIKELIEKFKTINTITEDINFKLKDQDDPNIDIASRDVNIKNLLGNNYTFTKDYLVKTYGIELEEQKTPTTLQNKATFINSAKPLSHQEAQPLDTSSLTKEQEELFKILQNSSSYEEALSKIEKFNNPKLEEALEAHIFANGILGFLEE
jgi:hypothetical protein